MSLLTELIEQSTWYTEGQISLADLHHWIGDRIELLLSPPGGATAHLAAQIEGAIAELDMGHRTEADVRAEISQLLPSSKLVEAVFTTLSPNDVPESAYVLETGHGGSMLVLTETPLVSRRASSSSGVMWDVAARLPVPA